MSVNLLLNWFESSSGSLLRAVSIQLGRHCVHSPRTWVLSVDATKAPEVILFGVDHW